MVLAWEALVHVIPDLYIGVLASFSVVGCLTLTRPRQHELRFHIPCRSLRALYQRVHTCIIQRLAQTIKFVPKSLARERLLKSIPCIKNEQISIVSYAFNRTHDIQCFD
jgi:hypothetical protein